MQLSARWGGNDRGRMSDPGSRDPTEAANLCVCVSVTCVTCEFALRDKKKNFMLHHDITTGLSPSMCLDSRHRA